MTTCEEKVTEAMQEGASMLACISGELHTRTYFVGDETVVVIGNRKDTLQESGYAEVEFVFDERSELIHVGKVEARNDAGN